MLKKMKEKLDKKNHTFLEGKRGRIEIKISTTKIDQVIDY